MPCPVLASCILEAPGPVTPERGEDTGLTQCLHKSFLLNPELPVWGWQGGGTLFTSLLRLGCSYVLSSWREGENFRDSKALFPAFRAV